MSSSFNSQLASIAKTQVVDAEWKLALSYRLQQSLELRALLDTFYGVLKEEVSCDYFYYGYEEAKIDYHSGKKQKHFLRYDLRIGEIFLGKVALSRLIPFAEIEIEKVEEMVSVLLYAMRNALEYQRVVHESLYDPLTGVLNRASLSPTIEKEIAYSQREQIPMSLLIVDVDHFKHINDMYGHAVGDFVLCEVAKHLKLMSRKSDWLFRFGGDEFVLLLPNTDESGALILAERLRVRLEKKSLTYKKQSVPLTLSVGIASLQKKTTVNSLIELADKALYRAKSDGRNLVSL